ncbi:bola protein [Hyaloraphidium curvatum]|nr:bola protein [Hyaloraphidium curvatum]
MLSALHRAPRLIAPRLALLRTMASETPADGPQIGPMQRSMREKLTAELEPVLLEIEDESHKHAGHAAMKGKDPVESHFKVKIVSDKFEGKRLVERHKMVYKILDEELNVKGLHALQLTTKTLKEEPQPAST